MSQAHRALAGGDADLLQLFGKRRQQILHRLQGLQIIRDDVQEELGQTGFGLNLNGTQILDVKEEVLMPGVFAVLIGFLFEIEAAFRSAVV